MANQLGLIHPDMLTRLPRFYPATCTIQEPTLVNTYGEVSYTWANVTGMVSIPCRVTPVQQRSAEVSTPEQVYWVDWVRIALAGDYEVEPDQRAVVDSVNYDIRGVEHDGNAVTTYLMCRVVT